MSVACTALNKLLAVVFLWLIMLSLPVYHSSMITLSIYGVWAACSRAWYSEKNRFSTDMTTMTRSSPHSHHFLVIFSVISLIWSAARRNIVSTTL